VRQRREALERRGIHGSRRDLAEEFLARPFGSHTPDLQYLLNVMRSAPDAGKHFLYVREPHRVWELARLGPEPSLLPIELSGRTFRDLLAAERYVFEVRWRELFGSWPLEDQVEPVAGVATTTSGRLPLLAYASAQSVVAGDQISFCVSCDAPRYRADVVRLHCPDVGPDGPPFREEVVDCALSGGYDGRRQPIHPGSYLCSDARVPLPATFSFRLGILPTLPDAPHRQTVLDLEAETQRVLLYVEDGTLALELVAHGVTARLDAPLVAGAWAGVVCEVDLASGGAALHARARGDRGLELDWSADATVGTLAGSTQGDEALADFRVVLGAQANAPGVPGVAPACNHFNGKVERLTLFTQRLDATATERVARGGPNEEVGAALLDWDFAHGIADTEHVADASGNGHGASAHQLPARAVKSSNWDGSQIDWRAAPEQYAAVHFHEDDLADAGWDATHVLTVPPDWPSGCYALRLVAGRHEWRVPFFVRPRARRNRVAYLVPTATYAAYANMHLRVRAPFNEMNQGRLIVLDDTDLLLLELPELGRSTYDVHRDGSAVLYSSLRRPVTNFRPRGRIYKFCLDLLLVDWLEHEGVPFDVLTDEDLHREGPAALDGYAVTIVATHPEYYSWRMLDALEDYVRSGGRLMVLGGNAFYWNAEFHPERTGTVEVRRPGAKTLWTVDYSESVYNVNPAPGGELQKVGRPPARLSGSTYVTMGFDESRPYRRLPVPEACGFAFEGVRGEVFGQTGLLAGGAAGYEIDRAAPSLGTPRHAVRLATSFAHSNNFDNMLESWSDKVPPASDDEPEPVRADIVFFSLPSGGAVFSVGSIAWAGSLPVNGYRNDVRRVTANVLGRFLDPTPFDEPSRDGALGSHGHPGR